MDPDENYRRQVELALAIVAAGQASNVDASLVSVMGDELAELVLALNGWMSGGGFPPRRFERVPSR